MPQYTHALAHKFGFINIYPSKMIRNAEAAQKKQWSRHVCYNCADRGSFWQSEKMHPIAKNLLDGSRMDSSFWQGFCNCNYCICQGFPRRLSKEANSLNELVFWTKNSWTFHSLSYLSGLALTTLQGQRNLGSDTASHQQASLMATFFSGTLIVTRFSECCFSQCNGLSQY